jgi:hypothetical protein
MTDNSDFILTEEELVKYNSWAKKTATAMGEADMESWTLSVTFSFSNFGTGVVAHCESNIDCSCDLVIRDMFEG